MNIELATLQKQNSSIELTAKASDYPDLTDIGVKGKFYLKAKLIPIGEKFWLNGVVRGLIGQECPKCSGNLDCEFFVDLKILVVFSKKKEIEWEDNQALNFDEYSVKIGPNVQNFSVLEQIREQIILNCSITNSQSNLVVPTCESCKPIHQEEIRNKSTSSIDPRWEKLKDLL